MYLRPLVFAAVTPLALPDISSNAMDGIYFIMENDIKRFILRLLNGIVVPESNSVEKNRSTAFLPSSMRVTELLFCHL